MAGTYMSNDNMLLKRPQVTVTASTTLDETSFGKDYNVGTDALVITLPAVSTNNIGAEFTFRNIGAAGNNIITLSPNASDKIVGTITTAAADVTLTGTANKDLINTKATSKAGDFVKLRAVAANTWYIEQAVGVWAREA